MAVCDDSHQHIKESAADQKEYSTVSDSNSFDHYSIHINFFVHRQSGDVSGARARLLTERAELSRELTSLRLAVTQLETDLSRLNSDISTAGLLMAFYQW